MRAAELVAEADWLVSKRSGVHDMLQGCAIVRGYAALDDLSSEQLQKLEQMVARMRICALTGFFPRRQS